MFAFLTKKPEYHPPKPIRFESESTSDYPPVPRKTKCGIRHVQIVLLFFNMTCIHISRVNVSISLVAMNSPKKVTPTSREFYWTEKEKSAVVSCFYWTYLLTQIPGAVISKYFGTKLMLLFATLFNGVLSLLIPLSSNEMGAKGYCLVRLGQGLLQGVVFPCAHKHLTKWVPPGERNFLAAVVHTGVEFGNVLAFSLSGLIVNSRAEWPGIHYAAGGFCIGWTLCWLIFGADSPAETRLMRRAEKNYLKLALKKQIDHEYIRTPWQAIFSSFPFYAFVIVRAAEAWGLSTFRAQLPNYFSGVFHLEIQNNAFFTSLPFFGMWIFSYVFLFASRAWQRIYNLRLVKIRKVCCSFALFMPAVMLTLLSFQTKEDLISALMLITVALSFNSGLIMVCSSNSLDLTLHHAALLIAISNIFTTTIQMITPFVTSDIVTDKSDRSSWQIIFLIVAVAFFFANIFYLVFGSTHIQKWDEPLYILRRNFKRREDRKVRQRNKEERARRKAREKAIRRKKKEEERKRVQREIEKQEEKVDALLSVYSEKRRKEKEKKAKEKAKIKEAKEKEKAREREQEAKEREKQLAKRKGKSKAKAKSKGKANANAKGKGRGKGKGKGKESEPEPSFLSRIFEYFPSIF